MAKSQLPASFRRSTAYSQLSAAGIVVEVSKGAGKVVAVIDAAALRSFLDKQFPNREEGSERTAVGNLYYYRSSKAGSRTRQQVILLRGQASASINDQLVDLGAHCRVHGCFSALQPSLNAPKICVVENLDCFLRAEEVIGDDWIFIHPYGRWGINTVRDIDCQELLHFGDYDYTGLNDYLLLCESKKSAKLHLPEDLEARWQRYSTPLKKGAQPSKRVSESELPEVKKVLKLLSTTNRFLEQQALFIPKTAAG